MLQARIVIGLLLCAGLEFGQGPAMSPAFYYATPPYIPFPAARLNDASSCGAASAAGGNAVYTIEIAAKGTPDSFRWRRNDGPMSPPVGITGACQTLADGIGIRFGLTAGHTVNDQWTINLTVSAPDRQTVNQRGVGAVSRTAEDKLRELLLATDFAVDPSGQTDSTAGLQAGINQSRISGPCLMLRAGIYRVSGPGLLLDGGKCIESEGNSQATLLMTADNMTAITIQGYGNKVRGLLVTKAAGVKGGIGVMVNTSSSIARGNTQNNQIEDLWIVPDDPAKNLLTAGVLILGGAAGEVVYTQGYRVHVQGAIDGWKDSTTSAEINAGFQNNANWCTDCNLENSARCLYLNGVGEAHFYGLSLNGCNAVQSTGTISVANASTAVVGTGTKWTAPNVGLLSGAPLYVQGTTLTIASVVDGTHLTLAAGFPGATATGLTYGIGEAPIVMDSVPYGNNLHAGSMGNIISWNTGEPAGPWAVFDSYTERNLLIAPAIGPGFSAQMTLDLGGKNMILSSGNLFPSYDSNGFPQLWIGQTNVHLYRQFATFQISETGPAGLPGQGQNDIFRIQKALAPNQPNPVGAAWLDFNPYTNGLYLDSAPGYRGSTLKLDTRRTDAGGSGSVDFMRGGQPWANIRAVVPSAAGAATELHLSTISAAGGAPADQGAIATRLRNRQLVSLGPIAGGACASGKMAMTGAVIGDSVAPAWPIEVFGAKVTGSMVVSAPDTITINVCNLSGSAVNGNASYGAVVLR